MRAEDQKQEYQLEGPEQQLQYHFWIVHHLANVACTGKIVLRDCTWHKCGVVESPYSLMPRLLVADWENSLVNCPYNILSSEFENT